MNRIVVGLIFVGAFLSDEARSQTYYLPGASAPVGSTKVSGVDVRVYKESGEVFIRRSDQALMITAAKPPGAISVDAFHVEQGTGVTAGSARYSDGRTQWVSWSSSGLVTPTGPLTTSLSAISGIVNGQGFGLAGGLPSYATVGSPTTTLLPLPGGALGGGSSGVFDAAARSGVTTAAGFGQFIFGQNTGFYWRGSGTTWTATSTGCGTGTVSCVWYAVDRRSTDLLGGNIDGLAAGRNIATGQFISLLAAGNVPLPGNSFAVEATGAGPIWGVDSSLDGLGYLCVPGKPCAPANQVMLTEFNVNLPSTVTGVRQITSDGATLTFVFQGSFIETVVPNKWDGGGASNAGIFRSGFFWLEDVNGDRLFTTPPDRAFAFGGVAGDIPITGDWNGDGRDKVGVYRPLNGLFILDFNGDGAFDAADKVYNLGVGTQAGDVPVVGDWNGSGTSKVGLFRQGFFWILDTNGNGMFDQGSDQAVAFGGVAGDKPVVGDWDGNGTSNLGLFRLGFFWILDVNGNGQIDSVNQPNGDKAFAFGGLPGDVPLVGRWTAGDAKSKVGVFRAGFFWVLDANGNTTFDGTGAGQDLAFAFGGLANDKPVVGRW